MVSSKLGIIFILSNQVLFYIANNLTTLSEWMREQRDTSYLEQKKTGSCGDPWLPISWKDNKRIFSTGYLLNKFVWDNFINSSDQSITNVQWFNRIQCKECPKYKEIDS